METKVLERVLPDANASALFELLLDLIADPSKGIDPPALIKFHALLTATLVTQYDIAEGELHAASALVLDDELAVQGLHHRLVERKLLEPNEIELRNRALVEGFIARNPALDPRVAERLRAVPWPVFGVLDLDEEHLTLLSRTIQTNLAAADGRRVGGN